MEAAATESVVSENEEETEEVEAVEDGKLPAETTVEHMCNLYGSRMAEFPPELVEVLAKPTVLRDGKEAFVAFRYGTRRFKITFEQIDRLRIPKEAK